MARGIVRLALLFVVLFIGCKVDVSTAVNGGNTNASTGQIWMLRFEDTLHPQTIKVYVSPYTNSGTWGQTGDSPLLWMYDASGNKCFNLLVGGNVVHDSPNDRFSCVNLGGAGCGMQTIGTCSFSMNGHFPNGTTVVNGTYTLTTTNAAGQKVSGTQVITGSRQ